MSNQSKSDVNVLCNNNIQYEKYFLNWSDSVKIAGKHSPNYSPLPVFPKSREFKKISRDHKSGGRPQRSPLALTLAIVLVLGK